MSHSAGIQTVSISTDKKFPRVVSRRDVHIKDLGSYFSQVSVSFLLIDPLCIHTL